MSVVRAIICRGDWHGVPAEHKVGIQGTPHTTQLLHAVGVAHAAKLRGENNVVLALDAAAARMHAHDKTDHAHGLNSEILYWLTTHPVTVGNLNKTLGA